MDIILSEKMKIKHLRRLVQEAIDEVLNEVTTQPSTIDYTDPGTPDQVLDLDPSDTKTIQKIARNPKVNKFSVGNKKIKEVKLEEAATYRLSDENFDSAPFRDTTIITTRTDAQGNRVRVPISDIIEYIRENPGVSKKQIFTEFNLKLPQVADALIARLYKAGILSAMNAAGENIPVPQPRAAGEEPEEEEPPISGPEALFMGNLENPLSMYFDDKPNADGSEDFPPEEPETPKAGTPISSNMSDEDYEAFMKYDDLKKSLSNIKSNIAKAKKSGGASFGDIKDEDDNSAEVERLEKLKSNVLSKMKTLVDNSQYLQNRIKKEKGESPIESEEEPLDEGLIDDYDMRKLKYYAGIIK
jgi:hypothetical protein